MSDQDRSSATSTHHFYPVRVSSMPSLLFGFVRGSLATVRVLPIVNLSVTVGLVSRIYYYVKPSSSPSKRAYFLGERLGNDPSSSKTSFTVSRH